MRNILARRSLAKVKLPGSSAISKVSQRHLIPVHLPPGQEYRCSARRSEEGIIEHREGRPGKWDEHLATLFRRDGGRIGSGLPFWNISAGGRGGRAAVFPKR